MSFEGESDNETIEENSDIDMIEGVFKISKRGGSFQITLPPEVLDSLDLKKGDFIKYFVHKKSKYAIMIDKEKIRGTPFLIKDIGKVMLSPPDIFDGEEKTIKIGKKSIKIRKEKDGILVIEQDREKNNSD